LKSELNDPSWVKYYGKHTLPEVLRALADVLEEERNEKNI
jgi:hypothetical protein